MDSITLSQGLSRDTDGWFFGQNDFFFLIQIIQKIHYHCYCYTDNLLPFFCSVIRVPLRAPVAAYN